MIAHDYSTQAKFFDEMMPTLVSQSAEILAYAEVLTGREQILEFGCGTGRISFPLRSRLENQGVLKCYVATDLSQEMLAVAHSRMMEDAHLEDCRSIIRFYQSDAVVRESTLPVQRFDAVIALCGLTSLIGAVNLREFFARAGSHLEKGGMLVVDSLHPAMTRSAIPFVDGSYTAVSETSGLVSFVSIEGSFYQGSFVWISGNRAFRFSECSELIPMALINDFAEEFGFVYERSLSLMIRRRIWEATGPVMDYGVYVKR